MDTNERLSRLRAAHGGESPESWGRVCDALEGWAPGDGLEIGLRYAMDLTREWSGRTCVAPREWVARAARGLPEPRLALARSVSLEGVGIPAHPDALVRSLGARLERLSLHDSTRSERLRGVHMLVVRRRDLERLRELDVRYTDFSDTSAMMFSAARHLARLERLDARWTDLTLVGRSMLVSSSALGALDEVEYTVYGSSLPTRPEPESSTSMSRRKDSTSSS